MTIYGYLAQPYLSNNYLSDTADHQVLCQVELIDIVTAGDKKKNTEIRRGKVMHQVNPPGSGYLAQPYLSLNYFGEYMAGQMNTQVQRIQAKRLLSQVLRVLYNTKRLRVLCDFPSRGTTGLNWTSTSTASGDYSVNNLNTDIVEQVWRSVSSVTSVTLNCDTEIVQGAFIDTLGILNHNMTTSASIVLQGANNAGFSPVGETINITPRRDNIYYIAPTLPVAGYRYWRFIINDPTNPDGYIRIGTIVFGSATILTDENMTNEVSLTTKHFSDKVNTEGFTNVSNDRALKYSVGLEFRNLDYNRENYEFLREVFDVARTSLKCLWIPTPQYPERFAVFGKLTAIPTEKHNALSEQADYIDFSIEVDESL